MATKFPKFGISLKTRRLVSLVQTTGNDFENHDGMTEEALPKIFATRSCGNHLPVDLQPPVPRGLAGNFQQWIKAECPSDLTRFGIHSLVKRQ